MDTNNTQANIYRVSAIVRLPRPGRAPSADRYEFTATAEGVIADLDTVLAVLPSGSSLELTISTLPPLSTFGAIVKPAADPDEVTPF